jgi:4-hydroxy-2-oxoheptanedioate aldolase
MHSGLTAGCLQLLDSLQFALAYAFRRRDFSVTIPLDTLAVNFSLPWPPKMPHTFKQLLAGDELIRVFALARVPHPIVVEMYALGGGYHGFWLDQEHGGLTAQETITAAMAARANNLDTFVRVAPEGYWVVSHSLESGAGGVMAAQIQSAEHAEQFVSWTKFAPRGVRGFNTSGRDALYTHKPPAQFAEDANRDSFVAIQIETLGALGDADAIAAIDGVDMLFVGPADMSQSLGCVGQYEHPKVWEAIDAVAAACRHHGKHWGTLPANGDFAAKSVERGCRMLTLGNDVLAMRRGIDAIRQTFSEYF